MKNAIRLLSTLLLVLVLFSVSGQNHPEIYITNAEKQVFLDRIKSSDRAHEFVEDLKKELAVYVERHETQPDWIVSRLQMYWTQKYKRVYVNGMDFSHGEGKAPVPTVRFSGSRDWATDYLRPALKDLLPYADDERGLYLQNDKKEGQPWEWVKPSETGHIIERINREILNLAEDAAFLYWLTDDEKYAAFASDILMPYIEGMYHRDPPLTVEDHKNAKLMGLQTFEVIHEGIIEPITICYDFLYAYLLKTGKNIKMIQEVFRKWADQEIKYGVPDNNWNLMQARFITYLALALEDDTFYEDGKGQQYYIDQVLHQNSEKQKALKDVVKNYDPHTGIWPEVAGYSIMVSDDLLEIYSLMDKALDNHLLEDYPILEKAIFANFHYLFPNDFTVAYGDAKHARLRFNSLELLIGQYRKYQQQEKEKLVTQQLKRFIQTGVYNRDKIRSLFNLFFYEEDLMDVPAARSMAEMVTPSFYSPNVSWIVQRNGNSLANGMMSSTNASLGNHSHTNGINLELFAKGMVIAPDAAAGVSYWTEDHRDYYSRFPAHNTVVVDGISDYRNMRGTQAFSLKAMYPSTKSSFSDTQQYSFSDVSFTEPSTDAHQTRLTGMVRTGASSGYFLDIFRSAKKDGTDKKHEYLFHGQGAPVLLMDTHQQPIMSSPTEELSSAKGDLKGYNYFSEKQQVDYSDHFIAQFKMPTLSGNPLQVNLWMKGDADRSLFTVMAPYSRAIHRESVPKALYRQPIPTLIVRQKGEAQSKPFVAIIDAFHPKDSIKVEKLDYFRPVNDSSDFVGLAVQSSSDRVDYIYNDAKGQTSYQFKDGTFSGSYGIVSYEAENLCGLFLGSGSQLEKGGWKIESVPTNASILVMIKEDELSIDSNQDFKLTMPAPLPIKESVSFKTIGESKEQTFIGRVIQKADKAWIEVELPKMDRKRLRVIY